MKPYEYARHDATGLAELVARGEVSPTELAEAANAAISALNPDLNAVVETYDDRIDRLDETALAGGPFRGVPCLIKDVGGHEAGRKIEFGSRLCEGMTATQDSNLIHLFRQAGVNVIGRSNTPEYSIAGSAENKLHGATSTPWRIGHSAGGSSGGAGAAVASGMVPIAHGSDIAGSIRIPASWSGCIGLKPSRGMVSAGPKADESGFGLAMNFVQTRSMRDTAAMLDCLSVPQPGDPFVVRRPDRPYRDFLRPPEKTLRIAWTDEPLMDHPVDPEVAAATRKTAEALVDMGYTVEKASLPFDHETGSRQMARFWFFGFDLVLDGYAERTGRKVGPDTLEPVTMAIYELAKTVTNAEFLAAWDWLNQARRQLGQFFATYDVLVSPATAIPSPPHGLYGLDHPGMDPADYLVYGDRPVQYSFPFNVAGAPAISLPLAQTSDGLPIGVQIAGRPQDDHLVIGLASALEEAMPWADRLPPHHAARLMG